MQASPDCLQVLEGCNGRLLRCCIICGAAWRGQVCIKPRRPDQAAQQQARQLKERLLPAGAHAQAHSQHMHRLLQSTCSTEITAIAAEMQPTWIPGAQA